MPLEHDRHDFAWRNAHRRDDPDWIDPDKLKRLRELREQGVRPTEPNDGLVYPGVLRERVEAFVALEPQAYIRGEDGFNRYIGAKFSADLVIFENWRYGNALYILYESWEEIAKRPRVDLLRDADAHFDRIIHAPGWQERLEDVIRRERHRRN